MKRILFVAAIAMSLMACSKQETPDKGEVTYDNTVTLSVQKAPFSRSISDQMGDPEYGVIGSAKIFFIDGSGTSIYQRELTATEITALANTPADEGGNTVTITGVPSSATTLYFMANIKTAEEQAYPAVIGTTSADARLRMDQLQSDAIHVAMSGQSGAFVPTSTAHVSNASVTISPILARFELNRVTCQNQSGTNVTVTTDITKFKLSGVFINYTRQSVMLSGAPYLNNGMMDIRAQMGWGNPGWDNFFNPTNNVFPYYPGGSVSYPSDWTHNSFADYCTPTNTALSFYPDKTLGATDTDSGTSQAWAYQICPSTSVSVGTPADVPHMILKLTDVEYIDNPLGSKTLYVTVTNYVDKDGSVLEFKRGNVYRIKNLTFTHNEATNIPYDKNISVTATVTVAPWIINNINPDWN